MSTRKLDPLHAACAAGDEALARELLDRGADASAPGGAEGWTPMLHLTSSREGDTDARCRIARLLVERGADPNERCADLESHDGWRTAYASAIGRARNVELARVVLELGAKRDDANVVWAAAQDPDLELLRFVLATSPPAWMLNHALGLRLQLGDAVGVRLLLAAGADANVGGGWGRAGTHLHHAVLQRLDLELIEILLEHGARLDARDRDGRTALATAYRTGQDEVDGLLRLRQGASDDQLGPEDRLVRAAFDGAGEGAKRSGSERPIWMRTDHQTLCWALRNERQDALERLLALGLDPAIADDEGDTPLHIAAERGLVDAVALLCRHDGLVAASDRRGRIPLDRALASPEPPRREIVHMLLDAGSDVAACMGFPCGDPRLDDELLRRGAVEHENLDDLFEQAADAVAEGRLETLRALIEETPVLVRARSRRHHHGTLLHYVGANDIEHFRQKTPPNAVDICRLLLESGSEVDALAGSYGGGPAQTTLALLASSGHPAQAGLQGELVGLLAEFGAKLDGLDDDGLPLATAISFRCRQAVMALARAGARLDNVVFAAACGRADVVDGMIDKDGRTTSASVHCRVPWLHMSRDPRVAAEQALVQAAACGHVDVVRLLAGRGVDVNAASHQGIGAIHESSFQGHAEVVEVLLELGADPLRREAQYQGTAYGWAFEGKHFELCRLIARFHPPDILDASALGWVDRVRELLDEDPGLANPTDGPGSPLRTAAYHGHVDLVRLLLERGADPLATNDQGQRAIDYAQAMQHAEIVRLLSG